jgi:trehalose/maltose hydrolase-like predicted phosphorylase
MVHEIEIRSDGPVLKQVEIKINNNFALKSDDFTLTEVEHSYKRFVFIGRTLIAEDPQFSNTTSIAVVTTPIPSSIVVPVSNDPVRFTNSYITVITTSIDTNESAVLRTAKSLFAALTHYASSLLDNHIKTWSHFLESKIEVTGDLKLVQHVNASFYYILSSIREDYPWGIPTCGLATNGYNGHVFSDSETWINPALIPFYPSLAKSVLEYRYNHREAARRKATSYNKGYKGTMYCWECAYTGDETCPDWAPTGQLEQHISGDIGVAVKRHWDSTGDIDWLKQQGYPLIKDIAEFWVSRVQKNADGKYEILQVVDMDERTIQLGSVNNSLYTNVCAKLSIDFAIHASQLLGQQIPSIWNEIAQSFYFPFDDKSQINLAWDGSTEKQWGGLPVLMLGYPVSDWSIPQQVRYNDIIYYSNNRTWYWQAPKGMTHSILAISWLEISKAKEGFSYFTLSQEDFNEPFMLPSELHDGGCSGFITGCGGFLQAILNGYGGIRVNSEQLTLDPQLPPNAEQFLFKRYKYWDNALDITIRRDSLTLTLVTEGHVPLVVIDVERNRHKLEMNKPLVLQGTGLTTIMRY